MASHNACLRPSLKHRIARWWHNLRETQKLIGDFHRNWTEMERLSRDFSLSLDDLQKLAAKGSRGAEHLYQRMAFVRLDPRAKSKSLPNVMPDLQRVCSLCNNKRRCTRDLTTDPDKSDWRQYCPNAQTLAALETPGVL